MSLTTYSSKRMSITCVACRSGMNTIIKLYKSGATEQELVEIVSDMCILMAIQTERVCRGFVGLNLPIILYIIDHQPAFTVEAFCGVTLQSDDRNSCPYRDARYEWNIDIPDKKKSHIQLPAPADFSLKIAQITDVHYDPTYEVGGLAECNEPACCRMGQTERSTPRWKRLQDDMEDKVITQEDGSFLLNLDFVPENREDKSLEDQLGKEVPDGKKAGFWGDYRDCDSPIWALEDTFNRVVEDHNSIDYIYFTGDILDHGIWETTENGNKLSINRTYQLMRETFGTIPVFPIIGNHESQPANQYAPMFVKEPRFSTAWLYNLLVEQWRSWLPPGAEETIREGGYYTTLARPGFRIVALNSNLGYRYNWWVHQQPKDPSDQLKWLVKVLSAAEDAGERVHILSHIPPGITDILSTWTREYKRIIERFSDTIAAEFNGHTHYDEFKIFYDAEDIEKPVAVAWNGGGSTPYSFVNPNYRVYDVDNINYAVTDFNTYIYNLTEANLNPDDRPRWFNEYSFKKVYGLSSLSPDSLDGLLTRMVTSEKSLLVFDYHNFRGKSSDPFTSDLCDEKCVRENLRYISVTELYDDRKYNALWSSYKSQRNTTT